MHPLTLIARVLLACLLALATGRAALAADAACQRWCEQSEAACSQAVRESRKSCAARAATGGTDPFARRGAEDSAWLCGWFRGGHCDDRWGGARCEQRHRARLQLCLDAYAPNTASQYLACSDGERQALALCREDLADCKAQCP